jgi:hypothetical protein
MRIGQAALSSVAGRSSRALDFSGRRQVETKSALLSIGIAVGAALATSLALPAFESAAAAPAKKTITCPFLEERHVSFDVPARLGGLPKEIDSEDPVKATRFSFRDRNLLFVAMDESDPSRPRIVISAQLDKKTGAYVGQIVVDMGGYELMLHNGPVRCTVGS